METRCVKTTERVRTTAADTFVSVRHRSSDLRAANSHLVGR